MTAAPFNCIKQYSSWLGTATMAIPIWFGTSLSLTTRFLLNPVRFCRRVKRDTARYVDPVPGVKHCFLQVPHGGIKLHAVTCGLRSGKPLLVFLHGFPETCHSWRHQVAAFKDDFEVVALDMRGFGLSDAPSAVDNYSMGTLCSDVAAGIRGAGHSSCILAGHDWGGQVAWCFAANYPKMVNKLIILCSPHPAAYKDPKRFTSLQARRSWYFLLFMAPRLPEIWVACRDFAKIEEIMTRPPMGIVTAGSISHEDLEHYKAALSRPGALTAAINYYRCSIRDQTIKPSIHLQRGIEAILEMPVLLMFAEHDSAFLDTMFKGTEQNVRNLTLVKIPSCSHWAQQDKPELVSAEMKRFLCNKVSPNH